MGFKIYKKNRLTDLTSKVILDSLGVPLLVDIKDGLVSGDDGIGFEERCVFHVITPEIEEPGNLVPAGDDESFNLFFF